MALGPRLEQRQSQSLVMTPQLQRAIRLLQMSNLDLATYIDQELERNPLLELEHAEGGLESEGGDGGCDAAPDGAAATDSFADEPDTPDSAEMANSETLPESDNAALDTEYENVWETEPSPAGAAEGPGELGDSGYWNLGSSGGGAGTDNADLENLATQVVTLRDHLLGQANVDLPDPGDRMIAAMLIETVDDAGYLTGDLSSVAAAAGCDLARLGSVLDRLKRLDPPGIFAANLAECLALQLRDRNRFDPAMEALLDNLDLLAKRDFTALRKKCGVSSEDLIEIIQEIKALNPKPASEFDHAVAQPVTPDVLVRRGVDGSWIVELNNETLPRVLVNSRYYARVSTKTRTKSEKEFLVDCLHSANWLVKSLQQRAQTILKVATELVQQQEAFFSKGAQHLRPLTLREVAEVVGVHESIVSRVTNNKFIGISRGIFEMKYFFTSAIGQGAAGEGHAAESIRFRIKQLIDEETPDSVLSDDRIVTILGRDGVDIARRTAAKYREALRIQSSVQRRRDKALRA